MCSHEEGLSNSLLEGMAAGLPMVVTDVGGNRESVSDEITALLVPPRDPIAVGRAILDLAWAKTKRIAMGRAGRQHVETEFGIDSCVTQHERLYEGLVEGLSGTVSEILDSRY
jgi:glycosyltransferase involved in cell wall biosynthesis